MQARRRSLLSHFVGPTGASGSCFICFMVPHGAPCKPCSELASRIKLHLSLLVSPVVSRAKLAMKTAQTHRDVSAKVETRARFARSTCERRLDHYLVVG